MTTTPSPSTPFLWNADKPRTDGFFYVLEHGLADDPKTQWSVAQVANQNVFLTGYDGPATKPIENEILWGPLVPHPLSPKRPTTTTKVAL